MSTPRISASSYSNTAPLIWSFLYGSHHGKVEIILDNAPARSAELLQQKRVNAALAPVIAYQFIEDAKLISGVCVGARNRVRSVCLATRGMELTDVKTISLDISSRTSVALTKIIFREFFGFEPEWKEAGPDITAMLANADAALLIGDPALALTDGREADGGTIRKFDLAELWHQLTGLGFVFAMWMTTGDAIPIDFAAARDEGTAHIEEIISNYQHEIALGRDEMRSYLSENISYAPDDSMRAGMELYFKLASKHGLGGRNAELRFV